MSLLELSEVTASYDGRVVLRDISMSIAEGERIAVVSGNGTGKSTLLKIISGLLKPERGTLVYSGDAQPAFLFQNPRQQLICASAREEISYSLQLQNCPRDDIRARSSDLLLQFGLTDIADSPTGTLSGGQQQRVALAALLTREPQLLLLDEPESFLDGRSRVEFRDFFERTICKSAVIWTCCRRSEVPSFCTAFTLTDCKLVYASGPHK